MNGLILCEGPSDAILLSYYLGKVSGWTHSKKAPDGLAIKRKADNQSIEWYTRGEDYLLICGVGGKDHFGGFYEEVLSSPIIHSHGFDRFAIVTDRDNRDIAEIESAIGDAVSDFFAGCREGQWAETPYSDGFGMAHIMKNLLLVIPTEQEGALETVLLNAISENPYDKNIVDKSRAFVSAIRTEAEQYISSSRLQLKADLGVVWSIQSPEKVFTVLNEQLIAVQWEQSQTLRACFGPLEEI